MYEYTESWKIDTEDMLRREDINAATQGKPYMFPLCILNKIKHLSHIGFI